jgi:hypothetical protein
MDCGAEVVSRDHVSDEIIKIFAVAEDGPHALRKALNEVKAVGYIKSAVSCVVATYLGQVCPGWEFAICADSVYGWRGDHMSPDEEIEFNPPSKMFGKFISWFDRGLLEELVVCESRRGRAYC